MSKQCCYDVCIIGAGPAGLACLSAMREPYSIDHLTDAQVTRAVQSLRHHHQQHGQKDFHTKQHSKPLRICVIDPHSTWMESWKNNFAQLQIRHLRSPAMAHPDLFDSHALLAYAIQHGREHELCESGCFDIKSLLSLGETQVGLWKLPSTELFLDFCHDMTRKLPHTYVQGHVTAIDQASSGNSIDRQDDADHDDDLYCKITIAGATNASTTTTQMSLPPPPIIMARNIILATGMVGKPVIPPRMTLGQNIVSWTDPSAFSSMASKKETQQDQRILVMGGGLTAVQVALRVLEQQQQQPPPQGGPHNKNTTATTATHVVLCSRRSLQVKHFDIPVQWFDRRAQNKCLSDFYHDTIHNRLARLREARNGGSVPPMYLKRLNDAVQQDRLSCWTGDVALVVNRPKHPHPDDLDDNGEHHTHPVVVQYKGSLHTFDKIILACGVSPDCTAHPVLQQILQKWPIPIHGGFPDITHDLEWSSPAKPNKNIFLCGALTALQVGPDAGNLMGIRRAALMIAQTLGCRRWLRKTALVNPFASLLLLDDSDDSDLEEEEDTESNEEDDCLSHCSDKSD